MKVPKFFGILHKIASSAVAKIPEFKDLDNKAVVCYLAILLTKLLKPYYFD